MNRFLNRTIGVFIGLWMFTGCAQGPDREIEYTLYVTHPELNMIVGEEIQITASPTSETFTWESSNENVATVSQAGEVRATGVGDTYILVSSNNESVPVQIPVVVTVPTAFKITGRPGLYRAAVDVDIRNNLIQAVKITCSDTNESIVTEIDFQEGIFTSFYEGLSEGTSSFEVVCLDRYGNESLPTMLKIYVYGEEYLSKLPPTGISVMTVFGNGLVINWSTPMFGDFVEITYTNTNNELTTIPVTDDSPVYILDIQTYPFNGFSYVTGYDMTEDVGQIVDIEHVITAGEVTDKRHIVTSSAPYIIPPLDWDLGGEGIGFHSGQNTNYGGVYRNPLGDFLSDRKRCEIYNGEYDINGITPDDWQMYTVYVEDAGIYALDYYTSVSAAGRSIQFEVDGAESARFLMTPTGNWDIYRWGFEYDETNPPKYNFTKGIHTIKVIFRFDALGSCNYKGVRLTYSPD